MAVKVHLKHLHISPRKVRLVADLVRGKDVFEAQNILKFTNKKSALSVGKLLHSAIATAKNDFSFEENNLYISEILVNDGPTLKRWMPRAHGRAYPIMKRTCHVVLSLEEKVKSKKKVAKKGQKNKDDIKTVKTEEELKDKAKDIKEAGVSKNPNNKAQQEKFGKTGNQSGLLKKVFRRKSG